MNSFLRLASVAAGLSVASTSFAAIIGVAGGTAAPSATLGPYTMTPFANDTRANFTTVSSTQATPIGGVVGFSPNVSLREIGAGWATWSHGYTGDVYAAFGDGTVNITLTMPTGTGAFYFYAESDSFSTFTITATSSSTQIAQVTVGASGANYFGFYGTGGDTVTSVVVSFPQGSGGGAVGEFGIAAAGVPDGGSNVAFLGLAVLALAALRRRLA